MSSFNPDEAWYKSAHERSVPSRYRGDYSDIALEYDALERQHEVWASGDYPVRMIQPIQPDFEGDEMVGYWVERFDEVERYRDTLKSEEFTQERLDEILGLEALLEDFYDAGVPHGDLNSEKSNIFSTPGSTVIIDPVGVPQSNEDLIEMRKNDLRAVRDFKDFLKHG
jgi:hypothetical protein